MIKKIVLIHLFPSSTPPPPLAGKNSSRALLHDLKIQNLNYHSLAIADVVGQHTLFNDKSHNTCNK